MKETKYDHLILAAVERHVPDLDWRLYKALLWEESKLNPFAQSPVDARGIAQFMPATWTEWSKKSGYEHQPPGNPEAAIFTGACYLAWLIGQWSWPRPAIDRWCLAMASYNNGLGDILKAQEAAGGAVLYKDIMAHLHRVEQPRHAEETITYVRRILGYYAEAVTE